MKNKIINAGLIVLLIGAVALLLYPMVSNLIRDKRQDHILTSYNEEVEGMTDEELECIREAAQEYNESLLESVVLTDPFDPEQAQKLEADYMSVLNLNKDGIMAYVEIPRIKVYEPVYHGVSSQVLAKGTGHLQNTSLPIGGESVHAVISGHTGMAEAEIFTDLNMVQEGDIFYIHVLNETLAYQVDQIKVVEPSDTEDLHIVRGKDYVTLVTCTPYGINSHRLLVRGTRIPYTSQTQETAARQKEEGAGSANWRNIYGKSILQGVLAGFSALLILGVVHLVVEKRKKK